jgi:hypothetical protein
MGFMNYNLEAPHVGFWNTHWQKHVQGDEIINLLFPLHTFRLSGYRLMEIQSKNSILYYIMF